MGETLPIGQRTLATRLRERNLLIEHETMGGKKRNTVRRTVEGQRRDVLCLLASSLLSHTSAPSAPSCQDDDETSGEQEGDQ
jgi:hypothetical protein